MVPFFSFVFSLRGESLETSISRDAPPDRRDTLLEYESCQRVPEDPL